MRAAAGALVLLALTLAGCGTGGMAEESAGADTQRGADLFKQKCGGCHALKAAGTQGRTGPNLDDAFAASRQEGLGETTIREVVLGQMRFPVPPMPEPENPSMFPSSEFSDDERDDAMEAIAFYVAEVAASPKAQAQAGKQPAGGGDPKSLFASNCGSCHRFGPAGTNGTVGPNLDETTMSLAEIVDQISNGGGGMPPFKGTLNEEQIRSLARYIANKGQSK